jgi:type IV secretion system protein TrbI
MEPEPQPGLVKRSGLWIAIGIFIAALLAFAVWDISRGPSTQDSQASANKVGKPQQDSLGPAPPPEDVTRTAEMQVAKAEVPAPVLGPRAPADARVTPDSNSPLNKGLNRDATASRQNTADIDKVTVESERKGAAAESSIFAVTGGGDAASSVLDKVGSAIPNNIQGQIDALMKNVGRADTTDPSSEIAKVLAGLQQPSRPVVQQQSGDQAWITGVSATTTSEATFAKTPVSPYMIFQGTRIPIVTREAINSDLPGSVTALSTSNVYDSINQCAVMVPAGTKFIGAYNSDVRPGQSRLLLSYRRMIFPDGRSVDLEGAQGVDQRGAAGSEADVNNHFLQMFGYGFAMAIIGDQLGGKSTVSVRNPDGSSTTSTIAGQVFSDVATRVLERNSVIKPTLSLEPGSRLFVTVVRDIALTPTSRKNCK